MSYSREDEEVYRVTFLISMIFADIYELRFGLPCISLNYTLHLTKEWCHAALI